MKNPNPTVWATYLVSGLSDFGRDSFWSGIPRQRTEWEDFAAELKADTTTDQQDEEAVKYRSLWMMQEAVKRAIPADKLWAVLLSGGVDSSILLKLAELDHPFCRVYSFTTNPDYDETKYAREIIGGHPWQIVTLSPDEVPILAEIVSRAENREPYGGIPTLAMYKMFKQAASDGVQVLLDGNGLDEQWGGYSYYDDNSHKLVQASRDRPTRPECLLPDFRKLAVEIAPLDTMREMQIRDVTQTKFPRCIRFNSLIADAAGVELRSPFMDREMIRFALRQPDDRKIRNGTHKWMERQIASELGLPVSITSPAKRAVQTPQREWLRDDLREWAEGMIAVALDGYAGSWLDPVGVWRDWDAFCNGSGDNAFFVWQWISLGMTCAY